MAKSKQTVNEVQLKARRTSLEKKSKDDLISIILRKDKSERKMNTKIEELTALLNEADSLNENKAGTIFEQNKDIQAQKDKIDTLIERNDNLLLEKNDFEKEIVRLKGKCNTLRKGAITFICVSIVLALLLIFL